MPTNTMKTKMYGDFWVEGEEAVEIVEVHAESLKKRPIDPDDTKMAEVIKYRGFYVEKVLAFDMTIEAAADEALKVGVSYSFIPTDDHPVLERRLQEARDEMLGAREE